MIFTGINIKKTPLMIYIALTLVFLLITEGGNFYAQSNDNISLVKFDDNKPDLIADTVPPYIPPFVPESDGTARGEAIDMPDDDKIRSNLASIITNLSENYEFDYKNFIPGVDRKTNWEIKVKDKFRDAFGTVEFWDKAGNDTVLQFRYDAPKFRLSPKYIEFLNIVTGDSIFTEFIIINESDEVSFSLEKLDFKYDNQGFRIEYIKNMPGYLSGLPKFIAPKDSVKFRVWFKATEEGFFLDSIGLGTSWAYAYKSQVSASVESPDIMAEDVNFYDITIGDTVEKEFSIRNYGFVDLKINAIMSTKFPFRTNLPGDITEKNPLIIKPGQRMRYKVFFTPDSLKFYKDSIIFFSNATKSDNITYIHGHGVEPGLIVTSYNFGRKRIDRPERTDLPRVRPYTNPIYAVTLINTAEDSIIVYDIEKTDNGYASSFEFIESDFKNLVLRSRKSKFIEIGWRPTHVGPHELIIKYLNSYGTDAQSIFRGIGVVPKITTYDVHFDSTLINDVLSPVSRRIVFYNTDWEYSDHCYIDSLEFIPEGSITVDTSDEYKPWGSEGFKIFDVNKRGPPWVIEKGDSLVINVNFVAQKEGPAFAGIRVNSDALTDTTAYLTGEGIFRGIKASVTDAQSCIFDSDTVIYSIQNYGWEDVRIDSMRIGGSDYLRFTDSLVYKGFIIKAQEIKEFELEYTPVEVEINEATITAYHNISGIVKKLETEINTESFFTRRGLSTLLYTSDGDSILKIGEILQVKVFLESGEDISRYRINDLFLRVEFNSNFLQIGKDNIKLGEAFKKGGFEYIKDSINIDYEDGIISFPLRAPNGFLSDAADLLRMDFKAIKPYSPDSLYESSIMTYINTVGNHCVEFYNSNTITVNLNENLTDNLRWKDFTGEKNRLLDVYPNPVTGNTAHVEFEIKQDGHYEINIYNSLGNMVENIFSMYLTSGNYVAEIPVPLLASGFYTCVIKNSKFSEAKNFVIIK
jgi:hypothetical protein